MANQTINRCVWLVDTIRRHGRITRRQLEEAWERSPYYEGKPLSRRTFCNHRLAAEELFRINILCDTKSFEYYIDEDDENNDSVTGWLLNSVSLNDTLVGAREITDRIFVENVPSARDYLGIVIDALKGHHPVRFDYHPYTRSLPTAGVVIEPYFLKLFKQRWYVVGRNVAEGRVKTYALDRIRGLKIQPRVFVLPADTDPKSYFKDAYGIMVDKGETRRVVLRVDTRQAKYLRALPLHHSQVEEEVNDGYSRFTYRLRLTADFVSEIISLGNQVVVEAPRELRAMVITRLRDTLANYPDQSPPTTTADLSQTS